MNNQSLAVSPRGFLNGCPWPWSSLPQAWASITAGQRPFPGIWDARPAWQEESWNGSILLPCSTISGQRQTGRKSTSSFTGIRKRQSSTMRRRAMPF